MTKRKFTYTIAIILLIVIASIFSIVGGGVTEAHAAAATSGSSGSDVLDDLKKDPNFKAELYPINAKDNTLNVIQIAESTEGELLIYVYQPNWQRDFRASSINIARQANEKNATWKGYALTYLNSSGVFYKYRVEKFKLDTAAVRYYNISNILRPYDRFLDEEPGGDNTISEVPNKVGQLWTVTTVNGVVSYSMTTVETIEITKKHVGFVEYADGVDLGWAVTKGVTNAHLVAFDTDRPIDNLLEADIEFSEQEVNCKYCGNVLHLNHKFKDYYDYEYGQKKKHEPNPLKITFKDRGSNDRGDKSWYRIRKTEEFIKDENNGGLHLSNPDNFNGTKWVLSFYETTMSYKTDNAWLPLLFSPVVFFTGDADVKYTIVSDVMILRLKFETDGVTYNLGVVDNKQTGSGKPENAPNENKVSSTIGENIKNAAKTVWDWIKNLIKKIPVWGWILIVLAIVGIVMGILSIFLPAVRGAVKVIFKGLLTALKCIVFVIGRIIALPFRLIGKLFGGIKNRIEERRERNEYLRAEKIDRKDRATLERYQNKLDRKESNYKEKLDEKDMAKKQKRKAQAKKRSSKK